MIYKTHVFVNYRDESQALKFIWIPGNIKISLHDEVDVPARDSFVLGELTLIYLKKKCFDLDKSFRISLKSHSPGIKPMSLFKP